ncbi:hypothetical protein HFO93_19920 [Rhizobium leguminosarum]|uniref:hypothetical protein n=1 Tax=Rhizobium leguminosarum TaxID=384 RepID=UPI001C97BBC2|nr:hypothetical protein [Rhizobium leguminosarum]MBY5445707.1 hypothetical protein [Rhizobium leguminosarum]
MTAQYSAPSIPTPAAFWTKESFIFEAMSRVKELADRDIDNMLCSIDAYLKKFPNQSLSGWSMHISLEGVRIEMCPLEIWMDGTHFGLPGAYWNFEPTDTLSWLSSAIVTHRDSLRSLMLDYKMLELGYKKEHRWTAFEDAIERKTREAITYDFEVDDDGLDL